MGSDNYRIVPCCFYCDFGCSRSGTTLKCRPNYNIALQKEVEVGGLCDDFRWARDNEFTRLRPEVMPPEALGARGAAKIITGCPIVETGKSENPCRNCSAQPYCDVGQLYEEVVCEPR